MISLSSTGKKAHSSKAPESGGDVDGCGLCIGPVLRMTRTPAKIQAATSG